MRAAHLFLGVVLILSIGSSSQADVFRVPDEYPSIRDALNAQTQEGDSILVAAGTYTGFGNTGLIVGFRVFILSEDGPDLTTIDCEQQVQAFRVIQGNPPVIGGFTIQNGVDDFGGGISCDQSSPEIIDCRIISCSASRGGAIYACGGSPRIADCVLEGNRGEGAGVYVCDGSASIEGCVIAGNDGYLNGGGISCRNGFVSVASSVISGNTCFFGGGIYLDSAEADIVSTTVAGNGEGGGIHLWEGSLADMQRVIVWGNCGLDGYDEEIYVRDPIDTAIFDCCAVDPNGIRGDGNVQFVDDNVFEDPRFCDPVDCLLAPDTGGDHTLFHGSPCLPENSPCGLLIGALGEGCQPPIRTESVTWGWIKKQYHR